MPSSTFASRLGRTAVAVVLAGAAVVALQAGRVYRSTGELRLTPSAAPPRLQEFGRLYLRSDARLAVRAPGGVRPAGSTPGGGRVVAPRLVGPQGGAHVVPTVLWVRDPAGRTWTYALSGGP